MLKAVIFDFDGVVADSELLHYKTFFSIFEPLGVALGKDEYYADYLGFSDKDGIDTIADHFKLALSQKQKNEMLVRKEQLFRDLAIRDTFIIEGVFEFISMLKSGGVRIAVCSGALENEIRMILSKSDFADAFEVIVSADDVNKGKPDPEPYLLTLEKLDNINPLNANECVVIEDSFWGLKSAANAGMHPVGITNTYSAEELGEYAEKMVGSLSELTLNVLKELCAD